MVLIYLGMLLVAAAVCSITAWLRLRRARAAVLVQTLASIVGQSLPLVPAVRAAANAERRTQRKLFAGLADCLEAGHELSAALRSVLPACPGEIVGALQGAERGGTLPGVLQSIADRLRREAWQPPPRSMPAWYPLVLLVVLPLVVTFIMVFVVPKYSAIFEDFGVQLPEITLLLIGVSRQVAGASALVIVVLIALAVAIGQALIGRHFFARRPDRWQPLYATEDTLAWGLPGLRQSARNHALGHQLLVMQAALRAGHDLPEAARQGACAGVNWHARRRLIRWAAALESGTGAIEAARRLGFPAPFVRALTSARSDVELAARWEYLAEYYQALERHWRHIMALALTPLMVIAWALIVGFVVVALFLPLVALLQGVLASVT